MKIAIDNKLAAVEFGRQSVQTNQVRYYYQVPGYPDLVMVCHDRSYPEWRGKTGILLVETRSIRGDIICSLFPKAPSRWRTNPDLVQITIRADRRHTPGKRRWLSEAVAELIGPATHE
jgi:hypothetical protein